MASSSLKDDEGATYEIPSTKLRLLPVSAIYGPNASGKSNVLAALAFMRHAVVSSQRHWTPDGGIDRDPFRLDPDSVRAPSFYEIECVVERVRYRYGFLLDSASIIEEWLFAYPRGKQQKWYTRSLAAEKYEYDFGRELRGENNAIVGLTRSNSLFLSAAAQNNHEQLTPLFRWFRSLAYIPKDAMNLLRTDSPNATAKKASADESFRTELAGFMQAADLGISEVVLTERELSENALIEAFRSALKSSAAGLELPSTHTDVAFRHKSAADPNGVLLPLESESAGTQALFALAEPILAALRNGTCLVVDELDSSMHPNIAIAIVAMFKMEDTNPQAAQLVFNTHNTNLLMPGVLRRDEVWLAEKSKRWC